MIYQMKWNLRKQLLKIFWIQNYESIPCISKSIRLGNFEKFVFSMKAASIRGHLHKNFSSEAYEQSRRLKCKISWHFSLYSDKKWKESHEKYIYIYISLLPSLIGIHDLERNNMLNVEKKECVCSCVCNSRNSVSYEWIR